ncbi:MAG TPA: hypothetical protein PKI62_14550 [bacterium]|nr:hypothetical protein [bacterium]HPR89351.1 hypothetical protein [bacterium]
MMLLLISQTIFAAQVSHNFSKNQYFFLAQRGNPKKTGLRSPDSPAEGGARQLRPAGAAESRLPRQKKYLILFYLLHKFIKISPPSRVDGALPMHHDAATGRKYPHGQ